MDDIHNNQKKIALINDFSGFGRCSIAVQLPVMSMMRVQCCPVPTSIFSNHTGFPEFQCTDFTGSMPGYVSNWKKLGLHFKGICTGFLGSSRQIGIVSDFIHAFKSSDTTVLVDPVMGDYGHLYPTYTEELCHKMRRLVELADIVTPNLTEACFLAGVPYREKWKMAELIDLSNRIAALGVSRIVITGIPQKTFLCNLCFDKTRSDSPIRMLKTHKIGTSRSGTGDIFSAILAADAVNGVPLDASVRKASLFIRRCILKAIEMDIPVTDGVPFEEVLSKLSWK